MERPVPRKRSRSVIIIIVCMLLCLTASLYAIPPRLHVDGNKIKDPNGDIVVLRGVSLIDLGFLEDWQGGAIEMIDRLTDQDDSQGNSPGWYPTVFRIPVMPPDAVDPPGSWPHPFDADNNDLYDLLRSVVDYCASKEIYAIIDWHYVANTYDNIASTSEFWTYMAPRFADDTHVIFELFNEPINTSVGDETQDWLSVRDNMQTWIDIVRTYAPDNLILVAGPSWSQAIGPAATYPVSDPVGGNNIAYVSHIYPYHWSAGNPSWYTNHITAVADVYPVFMTEWGFSEAATYDLLWGTITDYGQPLTEFIEGLQISSTAWVASYNWEPSMFNTDWTLRTGEGEMGYFVKDFLYATSGVAQDVALTITKCKIKAGKTQGKDSFDASGTFASSLWALYMINQIDVNIISLTDDAIIYSETIEDFNVYYNSETGKFNYSYKIPTGSEGAITSLKFNFSNHTFTIKAKDINLTGLASPLELRFTMGNYTLSGEADEAVINGRKTIPTRLMRTYQDTLIVTKAKAKASARPLSDSLSVKGDIAVIDVDDSNLVEIPLDIIWGDQTFTVPAGRFVAGKSGNVFSCSKVASEGDDGLVTAKVDFDKCVFSLSVKEANDINIGPDNVQFGLNFDVFDEIDDVNLVLGY